MDSTVVQEIANQLGMAVDQAGQFITDNLPAFAGMKIVQLEVPLITVWVVFVIALIAAITGFALAHYLYKKGTTYDSDGLVLFVGTIFACIAIIALFIALIMTSCNVPQIIGWQEYPQAMLIDMALKAVG